MAKTDLANLGQLFMQGYQFGQGVQAKKLQIETMRASIKRQQRIEQIVTDYPDDLGARREEFARQGFPDRARKLQIAEQAQEDLDANEKYRDAREQAAAYALDPETGERDEYKFVSRLWDLHPSSVTQELTSRYFNQRSQQLNLQQQGLQLQDAYLEQGVEDLLLGQSTSAIRNFQAAGINILSVTPETHTSPEGDERQFFNVEFADGSRREMTQNDFLELAAGPKAQYAAELAQVNRELQNEYSKENIRLRDKLARERALLGGTRRKATTPKKDDRDTIDVIYSDIKKVGPPGVQGWEDEDWVGPDDVTEKRFKQIVSSVAAQDQAIGRPFETTVRGITSYLFEHRTKHIEKRDDQREFYPFLPWEQRLIDEYAEKLTNASVLDIIRRLTDARQIQSYKQ